MISRHFNREEFQCKCGCGSSTVDAELIRVLEDLRVFYRKRIFINSGHRCNVHNKKIGGAENSLHLCGKAADIVVECVKPANVFRVLNAKYPCQYGIGNYKTFTHIDVRTTKKRW